MQQQKSQPRKTPARTYACQLKIRISDSDHKWINSEAEARDQTLSGVMRGLIKLGRAHRKSASSRN